MSKLFNSMCMFVVLLVGTTMAAEAAAQEGFDFIQANEYYAEVLNLLEKEYFKPEDLAALKPAPFVITYEDCDGEIRRIIKGLDNRWTRYYAPSDFVAMGDKVKSGLGLVRPGDGLTTVVDQVLFGTAAYKAGLRRGDRLLSIDGQPVKGLTLDQVSEQLRRQPGKYATLRYEDSAGAGFCSRIRFEKGPDLVTAKLLPGAIAYFQVRDFGTETLADTFMQEAGKLNQEAKGNIRAIVLDLRGNPGGYLLQANLLSGLFIKEGNIALQKDREGTEMKLRAVSFLLKKLGNSQGNRRLVKAFYERPLVLLVDGSSASAAEAVTAALKDRERATVIGTRTWGKSMYFYSHVLSTGGMLTVVGGNFYGPKGIEHHGVGIEPHLVVERERTGEDRQLAAALVELDKLLVNEKEPFPAPEPKPLWLLYVLVVSVIWGLELLLWRCLRRLFWPEEQEPETELVLELVEEPDVAPLLSNLELPADHFFVGAPCCGCGKALASGGPVIEALTLKGVSFYCRSCDTTEGRYV